MHAVITCLTLDHNLTLVALAGAICLLSSHMSIMLLGRAREARKAQWLWLLMAGSFGGFGIWSTHFIAMLAYDPGVVVGYQADLTILSLGIAIAATIGAVTAALYLPGLPGAFAAGLLFSLGVGSMHFTGMRAIDFPGHIEWNLHYVVASILLGLVFFLAAFKCVAARTRVGRGIAPGLLLTLGVVALHFTAMTGVTVVPGAEPMDPAGLLSPGVMVLVIATVSLSLMSSGFSMAIFAIRADGRVVAGEKNFKLLVQGVTDYAIYMLDLTGRVSNWNAGAQRAKGYTAQEIVGEDFAKFYSEEDRNNGLPQKALEIARTEGKFEAQGWRYRKDGTSFWAYVIIDPIYDDEHKLIGYAKITKDNTKQKADADRIEEVKRNLDAALQNMSQGICLFDKDERLVLANGRHSEIFRFPPGSVQPGMSYREMVALGYSLRNPDDAMAMERAREHYERFIAVIRSGGGAMVQAYPDGSSLQHIYNVMGDGGWVATFEDITERLRSEARIAFLAKHDALTGLPNRIEYNDHLALELAACQRTGSQVAVIGIDLDRFKEVNDQHGHAAGDTLLITLAERLKDLCEADEYVSRFGGDEFAAIKRYHDISELNEFLGRLQTCLIGEVDVGGFQIKTGASLGVAIYPSDAETVEMLLANADLAMYRAKSSLIQRVCFYEVAMDEAVRRRASLANDLWAAIEKNQLHLHFQVQKSVATNEITGYEVLLRWQHPERGNVPPVEFITLAEECGAILPIGEWVLREACREAASWTSPDKIAVNLSPVQLGHTDMAIVVQRVLLETGLNPNRLEIEITETSIITDKIRALHTLRQIKNLGVSIAIDDFGTGYSSLDTLRSFPFDKIKLDKSFMEEVETSLQAKSIVRAILALGQSLEVPVLAEGVETQAQLDILQAERCDEAQGYFLGRPMTIADIRAVPPVLKSDPKAA